MNKEIVQFFIDLLKYLVLRVRQIFLFTYAFVIFFFGFFSGVKSYIVSRMFWGRGSFYRTSFHLLLSLFSVTILISGISNKLNIFGEPVVGLDLANASLGNEDIFSQSGTSESLVLVEESEYDYTTFKHVVKQGESLNSIAALYEKNINTLVWANNLPNNKAQLTVGQVLRVPEIDGAFYKVQKNDTLERIAAKTKADVQDILDFNSTIIDYENPKLTEGMEIFIPNGTIPEPPKPVVKKPSTGGTGTYTSQAPGTTYNIPKGTLISPLSNCPSYHYSRGFKSSHKGVDLAKKGGCWEAAAAPGRVSKVGYDKRGGYTVWIDHESGMQTRYYHGTGQFAVKVGDQVKAGQSIMYMGCTGTACTGVHLHFELVVNGKHVNPENYVCLKSYGCSY